MYYQQLNLTSIILKLNLYVKGNCEYIEIKIVKIGMKSLRPR
jgi:hypothetical protein